MKLFLYLLAFLSLGTINRVSAQWVWSQSAYSGAHPAPAFPDAAPAIAPIELRNLVLPNTTIDAVTVDPKDGSVRVTATVTNPPAHDHITVWVVLPQKGWNGRFCGTGGGGFTVGGPGSLRLPLAQGFAAAATDGGTAGARSVLLPNRQIDWQAVRDFSYLGIHEMTVIGKAITQVYYGRAPRWSYFVGQSTGGRQGIVEMQRYPEDYDGILSISPAINWTHMVISCIWPQVVMLEQKDFVSGAKLRAAVAGSLTACGGSARFLEDPEHCKWDPAALIGTKVGGETFTASDAEVVRRIWEGPRGVEGRFLWYGRLRGTDLTALAGTTGNPRTGRPMPIPVNWIRYFLVRDPAWDWKNLTYAKFELLLEQAVEEYGEVFADDNPDLTRFRDRGGRILVLHGLADPLIPPQGTEAYVRRVEEKMGGADRTADFLRLFLVPGADHGLQGPGPKASGLFDLLQAWVEQGHAPNQLSCVQGNAEGRKVPVVLYPYK